jgi:hypothetical protein
LPEREDLSNLISVGHRLEHDDSRFMLEVARALLKLRSKLGALEPLQPNRVQSQFQAARGKRHIVLKARQIGMTTWIAATFFVLTITRPGTLTVLVAHDQRAAEEIFRIVHRFWANLPMELRRGALCTARCNVGQIVFPRLDSQFRIETAADADAGRGLTIQNLHASEVARWPGDAGETLATLRAAVTPQGRIVLESTPCGATGCFYQEWQCAPETGYMQHFFPWWWEQSYVRDADDLELTEQEHELVRKYGLSREQIAFRREIKTNFRRLAAQEFAEDAESCFLASGDCVFEVEKIDARLAALEEWKVATIAEYVEFMRAEPGKSYIIGVDSAAGGSDGDYCCAQVIERNSGMQCAELHGRWTPTEFADKLVALGRRYADAWLAVEVPGPGAEVFAHLGYRNYDNVLAVRTTASSKPLMIARLSAEISGNPESFSSVRLLREMRSFIRQKHGGVAAAAGAYDDCVMAMAVALEARDKDLGQAAQPIAWAAISGQLSAISD